MPEDITTTASYLLGYATSSLEHALARIILNEDNISQFVAACIQKDLQYIKDKEQQCSEKS